MKVRIQARKDMWRDIAEYLFAAYYEITLYFKPDMIIARDLTPDHIMLYDVRVKNDFFYGYKFEVVEDKEPVGIHYMELKEMVAWQLRRCRQV